MDLKEKKVAIIGVGKTGLATARFLAGRGARIAVTDAKPVSAWGEARTSLENLSGGTDRRPLRTGDPDRRRSGHPLAGNLSGEPDPRRGRPAGDPGPERARTRLAVPQDPARRHHRHERQDDGHDSLIGEILRAAGKKVFVGGNIGAPLIGYVDGPQEADWAVVEVSSFQLQWAQTFHPRIAVLLNVTTDHIDYHGSFAAYRRIKERIFARQNAGRPRHPECRRRASRRPCAGVSPPGRSSSAPPAPSTAECFSPERNWSIVLPAGEQEEYPLAMIHLPGRHNCENVMAAILAARACGCAAFGDHPGRGGFPGNRPPDRVRRREKRRPSSTTIPRGRTSTP